MNFSFQSYGLIWGEIKATGIHMILKQNTKFICSVECFEYSNFVISVWIFLAVLYDED